MAKDEKRTLTPRLRFPEFRKEMGWNVWPLAQLLSRPPEYGINAAAVPFSETLPTYIRITDIDDDGRFVAENKVSVDAHVDENNYLSVGDLVLARTGASVGKSYRHRECDGRLVFAGFLIRVRPDHKKLISALLASYVTTRQYWDWVRMTSARSGQPGINGSEYSALPVPLPVSASDEYGLSEQEKIADCLTSLDELIAAQGRKVETLKVHKRGLMQQLFPREGETLPRLRFPEFRDAPAWIPERMGDLAEVRASGDLDIRLFSEIRSGSFIYPVYSNAVEHEGLYGYYSIPQYPKDSITITARGTLGIAFYRDHDFMGIGRLLVVIVDQKKVAPRFMTECWNHLARIPNEVTSIPQLTAIAARATILPFPRKDEQQRIADCLSTLDARIAAEADKLVALKRHKQGLMQQLFPALEKEKG